MCDLLEKYRTKGFGAYHYPLDDEQIPDMHHCLELLEKLYLSLVKGNRPVIQ